ncbi:MAG: GNAT family N-acetyltransferase [Candidatus Eisenbacteria bacterium]
MERSSSPRDSRGPNDTPEFRARAASYPDEPELLPRVFALLDVVFPGLSSAAARTAEIGATWESVSRPFVVEEGSRILAHVGLIDLPLVLEGRRTRVGSIHAVATHPDVRRRGLFRRAMEVAEEAFAEYETLILSTENPEYYEPFGFRVAQEHEFRVAWDGRGAPSATDAAQAGNAAQVSNAAQAGNAAQVSNAARAGNAAHGDAAAHVEAGIHGDAAGRRRLGQARRLDLRTPRTSPRSSASSIHAPVSEVCGIVADRVVFCFNESRSPLWYIDDLDAICIAEVGEGAQRIAVYDVVATEMPPLSAVLERLPGMDAVREVVLHFSPDSVGFGENIADGLGQMGGALRAEPVARVFDHDGPSYLMVRGPFVSEGCPFTLPRSART